MPENTATVVSDDQAPPPPGVAEPLRKDAEGNSIYPEWGDDVGPLSWSVSDSGDDDDGLVVEFSTPEEDEEEEIVYRPPQEVLNEVKSSWDNFRRHVISRGLSEESLMGGVEKVYSTKQAAEFFGRSNQWLYWGLRPDPETGAQVFNYKNGQPIRPEQVGKMGKRRFTLPIIREIAMSCYRRGQIKEEELLDIMAKILLAEFGPEAFADAD